MNGYGMKNFEVAESRIKVCNVKKDYSIKDINRRLKLKIPLNDIAVILKARKSSSSINVKMLKFIDKTSILGGGFLNLQRELKRIDKKHIDICEKRIPNFEQMELERHEKKELQILKKKC